MLLYNNKGGANKNLLLKKSPSFSYSCSKVPPDTSTVTYQWPFYFNIKLAFNCLVKCRLSLVASILILITQKITWLPARQCPAWLALQKICILWGNSWKILSPFRNPFSLFDDTDACCRKLCRSENCISSALLVEMELSQPFGSFGFLAIQFTNEASKDGLKASWNWSISLPELKISLPDCFPFLSPTLSRNLLHPRFKSAATRGHRFRMQGGLLFVNL